jgi:hypothetical protein
MQTIQISTHDEIRIARSETNPKFMILTIVSEYDEPTTLLLTGRQATALITALSEVKATLETK